MTPLPGAANPLVGTWKLVSFQFEAEGSSERLEFRWASLLDTTR